MEPCWECNYPRDVLVLNYVSTRPDVLLIPRCLASCDVCCPGAVTLVSTFSEIHKRVPVAANSRRTGAHTRQVVRRAR